MPRFLQTGESFQIIKSAQYLVIHVTRINAFEAISDLGDPKVWATLEWGGVIRKSRPIPKPQLHEMFYFKLGVTEE